MDEFPIRDYKTEGTRIVYNMHKSVFNRLIHENKREEASKYAQEKTEQMDEMETSALHALDSTIKEFRKRNFLAYFFGLGGGWVSGILGSFLLILLLRLLLSN